MMTLQRLLPGVMPPVNQKPKQQGTQILERLRR